MNPKTVYFSDLLPLQYAGLFAKLERAVSDFGYGIGMIPETKDIWARDYMPHRLDGGRLLSYRYTPDYLQESKYCHLQSNPQEICESMTLTVSKSELVLDGGNLIRLGKTLILTDKVLLENPKESLESTKQKLQTAFEVERIALIPWDKSEYLGHADGMVRFIDKNTVLIQGYFLEMGKTFQKQLFEALEASGLDWRTLKFQVDKPDKDNWAYMNFLQTPDFILVPKLGIEEDQPALEQIRKHFSSYPPDSILPIFCPELIKKGGGGLNCISWN